MKTLSIAAAALFAVALAGHAQTATSTDSDCGQTIDVPLHARAILTIDARPSALEVTGSDRETLHVTCSADDRDYETPIRMHFYGPPSDGKLTIHGGPAHHGNIRIHVEVPHKINLRIEMAAGQIDVNNITGDKDINLTAGQLTITSDHAGDYRTIDASVGVGEVDAFGESHGGFFPSVTHKTAEGDYHLRAHITTGQISIEGPSARASTE